MADIIQFQKIKSLDRVFVCDCGCMTFKIINGTTIICSACDKSTDVDCGQGWLEGYEDKRTAVPQHEVSTTTEFFDDDRPLNAFTAKKYKDAIDNSEVLGAVVMIFKSGEVSVYDSSYDAETFKWVMARMDTALTLLTSGKK